MHVIQVSNVNHALCEGVRYLSRVGRMESSRAGDVIVAPVPVTTVYTQPWQRVLFSKIRDANPFFHLVESIWMLAGLNKAEFLNNYVKDFGERFAESGGSIHGAYGYRWRRAWGVDQLDTIVQKLRNNQQDRQCVLQMWGVDPGIYDLEGDWKDRPCNTHIYFRIVRGNLDMTVCCRSNDIIWGAFGANAVHMSVLQEYMAARIGVDTGVYYQISNNFHMYASEVRRLRTRASCSEEDLWLSFDHTEGYPDTKPVVSDQSSFDHELNELVKELNLLHAGGDISMPHLAGYNNKFLSETVWPAAAAYRYKRTGQYENSITIAHHIAALDWRKACVEWLERHK